MKKTCEIILINRKVTSQAYGTQKYYIELHMH